jgi:AP-1 complex subunit gamma-1
VTFSNNGPTVSSLSFEAAVPKYLQLQLQPASGNVVAMGQVATQLLVVRNSAAEKPILMKVRLNYAVEGQGSMPEHQGQVQFPM